MAEGSDPNIPSARLVEELADMNRRNAARDELLNRGAEATSALLHAADHPKNPEHYKSILRTLLLLKDPQAQSLFRHALASQDEEIRAIGARGLHLVKANDALAALLQAINDSPDPLHRDHTPAVQSLVELGISALPGVFELMDSPRDETRRRAQYVLAKVVLEDLTRQLPPRSPANQALQQWQDLQRANGSYQWDAPEAARKSSINQWKRWCEQRSS